MFVQPLKFPKETHCVIYMLLHTREHPHGPVHGINVSTDQHLHQEGEELRPRLRPVPVGDGWHGVCNTGADFADWLPQTAGQQLPDGGFCLEGNNKSPTRFGFNRVTGV